jgi:starvation-inducible DNA-binding protein
MAKLNAIGLNEQHSRQLSALLNDLLSNYQIFYMNARSYHWNIRGDKFFELHLKFEELYNDSLLKIDEIAERVLTLGYSPVHSFSDYIQQASVKEAKNVEDGKKAVADILAGIKILLLNERKILELSALAGDEGTNALMSDYIRQQEKLVWMYSAYLNK